MSQRNTPHSFIQFPLKVGTLAQAYVDLADKFRVVDYFCAFQRLVEVDFGC
jgi:hypothetical protein